MTSRLESALLFWAAWLGLAGVATAAAAAHTAPGSSLGAAALILLTHAPAIIACLAAVRMALLTPRLGHLAAFGLALGATLFSVDLACRTFVSTPLFPLAAPLGGFIIMIGWGLMACSAGLCFFVKAAPRDKDNRLR